ncbi:hypothetical protein [Streptomyces amritsarensis]|uniref:hypothetical protein n=1 Tax=Streptomyces amritsarensis TaxID=681158 RepID=UPI0036A722D0
MRLVSVTASMSASFTPWSVLKGVHEWYQPHTVAYAQLGHDVHPIEAYMRRETGAYLDDDGVLGVPSGGAGSIGSAQRAGP